MLAAKRRLAVFLVLCLGLSTTRPAHADIAYAKDSKAIGVLVAVVAVGALIGVGIYYAVHHGHSLTGCTASSPSGLELSSEADKAAWALTGNTQGIKPGDRIQVNGNKVKGQLKAFKVSKVGKDYGACSVT